MSRRNGRRLDRRNHAPRAAGLSLAQQFAALFTGQADAVYLESDNYNSGAGTWTDKRDPTHVMTATGSIAAPSVSAPFSGASMALTGTQFLTSNRAASCFARMHNGLAGTVLTAYSMTDTSVTGFLWNTYTSGILPEYQVGCSSATRVQWAQEATGGDSYNTGTLDVTAANLAVGVKTITEVYNETAATPQNAFYCNGALISQGPYTLPADASANLQTLLIGTLGPAGSLQLRARLRAFYFLPYNLSTAQRLVARAYMASL